MRFRWLLCALALAAVAGCRYVPHWMRRPALDERLSREDLLEARQVYQRACADCHGPKGRGDGPEAKRLTVPPSDLTTLALRHGGEFPREYAIQIITGERSVDAHGTREMPVWQRRFGRADSGPAAVASFYAARQRELLITYLELLQRAHGR